MIKLTLTWSIVEVCCNGIYERINKDGFKPDYIAALSRGGLVPGVILSHKLNCPLLPLSISFRDNLTVNDSPRQLPEVIKDTTKKILVVDDINDSGVTFKAIVNTWFQVRHPLGVRVSSGSNADFCASVKFAALVHNKNSVSRTDYSFFDIDKADFDKKELNLNLWVEFPWEKT